MRHPARSHSRAGFTLIELMAAVVVMSLIAATISALLLAFTRSSDGLQQSLQLRRTLARLGEQFRRDVRAARAAQHEDGLKLTTPSGLIEYRHSDEGLERLATSGAGEVVQRERYRFPRATHVTWELSPGRPQTITLQLTENADESQAAPRLLTTITAALGSDCRFDPPAGEQ